jgi:hypothetical protein
MKTVKQYRLEGKDEEVQWRGLSSTYSQCMYRFNIKAKVLMDN